MVDQTAVDTDDLDPFLNDLAGQVYSPDDQCGYVVGTGSYLLRVSKCILYDNLCRILSIT